MYRFDTDYFESINSKDKAYLLGFICTDGNLYEREGHQTQLQISVRDYDEEILLHFLKSLNSNHPIKISQDKRRSETVMKAITFVSDKVGQDLKKLKISINKTFSLDYNFIFGHINKDLWPSFLLGIFDGDGNIDYPKDGTISKAHVRLSGPVEQLLQIQRVLEEFKIKATIIVDKRRYTKPFGSLECPNTTSKYCLLKLLYKDDILCLSRKKENAFEIIKRIEDNVTNRKENIIAVDTWKTIFIEERSEWRE